MEEAIQGIWITDPLTEEDLARIDSLVANHLNRAVFPKVEGVISIKQPHADLILQGLVSPQEISCPVD